MNEVKEIKPEIQLVLKKNLFNYGISSEIGNGNTLKIFRDMRSDGAMVLKETIDLSTLKAFKESVHKIAVESTPNKITKTFMEDCIKNPKNMNETTHFFVCTAKNHVLNIAEEIYNKISGLVKATEKYIPYSEKSAFIQSPLNNSLPERGFTADMDEMEINAEEGYFSVPLIPSDVDKNGNTFLDDVYERMEFSVDLKDVFENPPKTFRELCQMDGFEDIQLNVEVAVSANADSFSRTDHFGDVKLYAALSSEHFDDNYCCCVPLSEDEMFAVVDTIKKQITPNRYNEIVQDVRKQNYEITLPF